LMNRGYPLLAPHFNIAFRLGHHAVR
jgi:hypothetical protein